MAQYYWEADSGDVGGLPTNATVTQSWHSWDTLTVESSSTHVDFPYGLKGVATSGNVRRVAAFSDINGNTLTQSGITEIYAVISAGRTYVDFGVMGRISGNSSSETGVGCKFQDGSDDFDTVEYDNASASILSADTYVPVFPQSVRVQYDGSTVRFRRWHYGDTEPGTWDFTETVGVTSDGDWGLHSFEYAFDGYVELLALGFGSDGDAAPTEPVSSGVTVDAAVASLTITVYAATVDVGTAVEVDASSVALSLTTYPASVEVGTDVNVGTVNLAVTTYAATVDTGTAVSVNADYVALAVTTYQTEVLVGTAVEADSAALNLTTYPASVSFPTEVNADYVAFIITTYSATVFLGGARAFDATPARSFDNDYGYFDGPDPLVIFGPTSIATAEALGTPEAQLTLEDPTTIPSLETLGVPELYHKLFGVSIESTEAFGNFERILIEWIPGTDKESTWTGAGAANASWSAASNKESSWEATDGT